MIHFLTTWRRDKRGQAAVEAAFIVPFLLFILFGIFVVGHWLNVQQVATAAAREGARVGAQTGSLARVEETVRENMKSVDTDPDKDRIVITFKTYPNDNQGSALTVRIDYTIPFGFAYFKSEYERIEKTTNYPFSKVAASATARLEQSFGP